MVDTNQTLDPYKSKTKQKQIFITLWSGTDFCMPSNYSQILVTVAVPFIYGSTIPILYPISALTLIVFYLRDRLMIFYGYREPPAYDEN